MVENEINPVEGKEESVFSNNFTIETPENVSNLLNSEKIEDEVLTEDKNFEIIDTEIEDSEVIESVKKDNSINQQQTSTGERKTAATEGRMLISIIDIFFGKLFMLISGNENEDRWRMKERDKQDLTEICIEWFKEEQLMKPKSMFFLAMFLMFIPLLGESIMYRYKMTKKKKDKDGFPEDLEDGYQTTNLGGGKTLIIPVDKLAKRKDFRVDNNGYYMKDISGTYLATPLRKEKPEVWKGGQIDLELYQNLVLVNDKVLIDKLFKII